MKPDPIKISVDSMFKDILPAFLVRQRENIEAMRSAYRNSDYGELERLGHMMKGSCGGYGFFALGNLATEVELAASMRDRSLLDEKITLIEDHMSRVKVEFTER